MTVSAGPRKVTYAASGGVSSYDVPFALFQASDLFVYAHSPAAFDPDAPGALLTGGVHYTVAADMASIAPHAGFPVIGHITLFRVTSRAQSAAYTPNDGFPAKTHERQLDRLSLVDQEIAEQSADTARVRCVPAGELAGVLPDAAARAGKVLVGLPGGGFAAMTVDAGSDQSLRTDLAAPDGAARVGVTRTGVPQAVYATVRSAADAFNGQTVDLREFGNVDLDNPFDLLDRATGAALSYSGNQSALNREILISAPLVFPAENRSIYVRRGQRIRYTNATAALDFSALTGNTNAVFRMGRRADGSLDPGGLPPEIVGLRTLSGPASKGVIECLGVTNPNVFDAFFTFPGIGIDLRGSNDAQIDRIYFDQGLTGILLGGQNHQIGFVSFYNMNFDVQVASNCYDCDIAFLKSMYPKFGSLVLPNGSTNVQKLHVGTQAGAMNEQYTTFMGFLYAGASSSSVSIGQAIYRNGYGPAINHASGLGSRLRVGHLIVDGQRTSTDYSQSSTAAAISTVGMDIAIGGFDIANLPGQPITFAGGDPAALMLGVGRFSGCTGGAADIGNTNSNGASRLTLIGARSDRTLLAGAGVATLDQVAGGRQTGWTAGTGVANKAAFAAFAGQAIAGAYSQSQAQAVDDATKANAQRILAIEQALRAQGIIN